MKAQPSIAFNDFSGTASEVTARHIGGRTILNSRAKQPHTKTPKQALRRSDFSYITKQFKTLSSDQMKQWSELARQHRPLARLGQGATLTAHNMYMQLNLNRSLLGVPLAKSAPSAIHGSTAISYEDLWVTPDKLLIAGLQEPAGQHHRLVVKMSSSDTKGEGRSKWGNTVIVSNFATTDWGEIDITKIYTSEFGVPIQLGRQYYFEIYWIDENSGYVSEISRIAAEAVESKSIHGKSYQPRDTISQDKLIVDETRYNIDSLDYELSHPSKFTSNDITAGTSYYVSSVHASFEDGLSPNLNWCRTLQWARGAEDAQAPYLVFCAELMIQNQYTKDIGIACRSGVFQNQFTTFGTYQIME